MDNKLQNILANYGKGNQESLIPILQRVQAELGYISEEAIFAISEASDVPPAEVFGTLTFYAQFRLAPTGKHNCKVCRGTACHVRGAPAILDSVHSELKIDENSDTTQDGLFTVEQIACFGACSLAPVMVLDGHTYGRMTPSKARSLIKKILEAENA